MTLLASADVRDRAALASSPVPSWRETLGDAVQALHHSREVSHNIRHNGRFRRLPSPPAVQILVDKLAAGLFPSHYGKADLAPELIDDFVSSVLADGLASLEHQIAREYDGLADARAGSSDARAAAAVAAFAAELPGIRNLVVGDLMAAYAGDRGAASFPEIMLSYPGVLAILHYRLARALHLLGAPLVARLIARIAHSKTAIDIHPGARIGRSFVIDQGTGVLIGETCVIGDRVRVSQGVTLGAAEGPTDEDGRAAGPRRHPEIEDDVVIQAGATMLGRITVGRGSVVGANVWLTQSVPPHTNLTQARDAHAAF